MNIAGPADVDVEIRPVDPGRNHDSATADIEPVEGGRRDGREPPGQEARAPVCVSRSGMMLSSASMVSDSVPVTSTSTLPEPPRTISLNPLTSRDSVMTFPDPCMPTRQDEAARAPRSTKKARRTN